MHEGFFDKNVFAHAHGHVCDGEVGVIGRADTHGIDLVAHFVEHDAEVLVKLRLRKF